MIKKVKILYDANPIINDQKSGIGYFAENFANSLEKFKHEELDITYFYFNFLNKKNDLGKSIKSVFLPGKLLSVSRKMGFQLPFEIFYGNANSDIIISTNYVTHKPLKKMIYALVIYDLGFIDNPEYIQEKNLSYLNKFVPKSIKQADLIITISNFTKNRIEDVFPETKGKIIVTPIPPIESDIKKISLNQCLARKGVNKKYILYLGTIEPRKNLENLVRAYCNLPKKTKKEYSLVLAGGKGWKDEQILYSIQKAKLEGNDIIQTGYINDEDKQSLYSNASLFVFPSHYEGFGMPILEAMQYKIPIAVSNIPVHHEVAGDGAVYFDKDDYLDIAIKMNQTLNDDKLSSKIILSGQKELNKYSWKNNADLFYEAVIKLLKN